MSTAIIPSEPQRLKSFIRGIVVSLLVCMTLVSGCSSKPELSKQQSEQVYYEAAQKALEKENYFRAVEQLRELLSQFPFGRYAIQAQLDLMTAHYKSGEYETASAVAKRFIREHPDHPQVDFAYYLKGLASFDIDRRFLTRLLPSAPSERNLTPIKKAFANFADLIEKHPQSIYAADARQRMVYCRNLLAEHEMKVAQYYFKRKAYVAAVNRAKTVLTGYPKSPQVSDALKLSVKAYKKLGMDELAQQSQKIFDLNFK